MLNKSHSSSYRIYFEDTDQARVMYHANHLKFFDRARTDMLRIYGYALTELAKLHCHFAIHGVEMQFLHPARLDDLITIDSTIEKVKACSILFEQIMRNEHNKLLCRAKIKLICVDESMQLQHLPPLFYQQLLKANKNGE